MVDSGCLFVDRKEIFKFKVDNKNANFTTLGDILEVYLIDLVPFNK